MKVRYDGKGDTLDILLSSAQIYKAEEYGMVIINYDKNGKPVEVEILNASKFLGGLVQGIAEAKPATKVVEVNLK